MSPGCPGEGLLIHFRSKCDIAFSSFLWRGDLSVTSWRPCGDNHFYLKNEKNIAFSSLLTSRCQFFGLVLLTTRPSQCTYKFEILSIYKLALSPFYRIYLARRHSRVEFLKNFLSLSKMSFFSHFWRKSEVKATSSLPRFLPRGDTATRSKARYMRHYRLKLFSRKISTK